MTTSSTGPLIPRRRLGAAFRELREARGETLQQTARALMFSPSKLSRIENGLAGEPHPRDVRDLIAHFRVDASAQAGELESLAAEGRVPGWWQVPPYSMPSRLDTFISYESAASRIEAYTPAVMPGYVQTPDYAAATLRRLAPYLSDSEVRDQVDLRMRRQHALRSRESPPSIQIVIPETVLRRQVGSRAVMRAQLEAVDSTYDDPTIDIRVIPFSSGIYEAIEISTVTVFLYSDERDPPVVALERVRYTQFLDRPDDVAKYRTVVGRLSDYWLDRSRSREFIREAMHDD